MRSRSIATILLTGSVICAIGLMFSSSQKPAGGSESVLAGLGPDIIVSRLDNMGQSAYGTLNNKSAFSIGTTSCNIGTEPAEWIANLANRHPVITQNMYRLKDDRFEQIGMSWAKHGFFAEDNDGCGMTCQPAGGPVGTMLGVGCSDPYVASINGDQSNLGPRSVINAFTGNFDWPFALPDNPTLLDRRIQVDNDAIDPALNPNAVYFAEGQYVATDDATAGNSSNNSGYRPIQFAWSASNNRFEYSFTDATVSESEGIRAWRDLDPTVVETTIQIPGEGRLILAAKAVDLGTGFWRYEYALQNVNSDLSVRSLSVPISDSAILAGTAFNDVDYHTGEPYDLTDWPVQITSSTVSWSTVDFATNPNANAIRWSTMYSFTIITNGAPEPTIVTVGLFKPGPIPSVTASTIGPPALIDCNKNGIVDTCDTSCSNAGCSSPDCDTSLDCNNNSVPDECERDCNSNNVPDTCDTDPSDPDGDTVVFPDCNTNTVPDECEQDCDGDGIISACDTNEDTDADGLDDCVDICPLTNPLGVCVCPPDQLNKCCIPSVANCQIFINLDGPTCISAGGEPLCQANTACRDGCLLGDADDNGQLNLRDASNFWTCYTDGAASIGFIAPSAECDRIQDFNADGAIDLTDYSLFEEVFSGPGGLVP